jgi:TonB-dependent SusC/RagA subfamily outer membrane receptor
MEPNTPNSALIVVDGVINNSSILNTLPTSEVESIKIVKDGGSALYGSRGGNGVVVIKMKK